MDTVIPRTGDLSQGGVHQVFAGQKGPVVGAGSGLGKAVAIALAAADANVLVKYKAQPGEAQNVVAATMHWADTTLPPLQWGGSAALSPAREVNMADSKQMQYWEVWYPKAAATGVLLARGRLETTDRLIMHAAPDIMTVDVYDDEHRRLAQSSDLARSQDTPMCLLRREGGRVTREDFWPDETDIGTPVLLPGGEVGILLAWWNAEDRKEWRWQVEFCNSLR